MFDSTGMAVQDVAVAALAYRKSMERNMGTDWSIDQILQILHNDF
ncbi:MAG: hypothetical protein ACOC5L_01110 [Halobacteriota archaeon]